MEYSKLVAVTGLSGLFEIVSSRPDGALVRSLADGATKFIPSRVHNLSHLESIEVYTVRDNVNLTEIFAAMKNSGEPMPDAKDNKALKAYFEKVCPDLDFERVYSSDMKKMVKWFEILQEKGIEPELSQAEDEEETVEGEAVPEPVSVAETPEAAEAAPKKPSRKKKDSTEEA